jgi:two-component system, OmpR family, response regulator CpxR
MRPKKTVLCVNPCEFRLSRQVFLLQTRGYQILRAESSSEALLILEGRMPTTIDVMVCDLLMPDMDGNELTRRAKQLHPELPVLLLSETVTEFTRELYAEVFLPKAANTSAELLERVRILVGRKRGPKKRLPPVGVSLLETEESRVA